ncbi:hypothetical protein TNCV_4352701 [Trichonephila clavipes]|nr:hypothetical protein TNCV_4352701 [Trichonephila clavipes]
MERSYFFFSGSLVARTYDVSNKNVDSTDVTSSQCSQLASLHKNNALREIKLRSPYLQGKSTTTSVIAHQTEKEWISAKEKNSQRMTQAHAEAQQSNMQLDLRMHISVLQYQKDVNQKQHICVKHDFVDAVSSFNMRNVSKPEILRKLNIEPSDYTMQATERLDKQRLLKTKYASLQIIKEKNNTILYIMASTKGNSQSNKATQIPTDMRLQLEKAGYPSHPPNDILWFVVDHTIEDAPVCDATSRVAAAMISELRFHAAANVVNLSVQTLFVLQTTPILNSAHSHNTAPSFSRLNFKSIAHRLLGVATLMASGAIKNIKVNSYLEKCCRITSNVEAYGGNALSRAQCYRWFEKFQNGDFDVRNEERGRPAKKFEDTELQALLDEDDGQTQEHLA